MGEKDDLRFIDNACIQLSRMGRPTRWAAPAGWRTGPPPVTINGANFPDTVSACAYLLARLREICVVKEHGNLRDTGGPFVQEHGYHGCANVRAHE